MQNNIISIVTKNETFYNQLLHFIPPNVSYGISKKIEENTILIISDGIDESIYEYSNIPIFIISDKKPKTEISFYFYEYGKFEAQSFLNDFHKELNIFQNEEKHKIEIERLEDEIKILNDVIKDYEQNMVKAERVQSDIMTAINMGGYDASILYKPYKKVSGDLFLAEDFGDKTYIMIGDVVNHGYFSGLYGASIYSLAKSYLMTTARFQMDIVDWARFLQRTSSIYQGGHQIKQEEAVTVLLCEIDRLSNRAKFLNCGHGSELPILINLRDKKNPAKFIGFENKIMPPIGGPLISNIHDYVVEINFFKGNGLIFYSDGIPETFQTQKEDTENLYSKERMLSSIKQELKNTEWTTDSLINSVIKDLKSYSFGTRPEESTDNNDMNVDNIHDDITMACIVRTRE